MQFNLFFKLHKNNMTKVVLASNNQKKINEMQHLLSDINLEIIPQSFFNIGEADEPYQTFVENALAKARYASKKTNLPAIADDSGICVDHLDFNPGVRSARFAHEKATDDENLLKLLDDLEGVKNRNAHYYCSIVFVTTPDDPQPIICEGVWKGKIVEQPRGSNGFGYDPIFEDFMTENTAAELDPQLKNKLSHRGQALQQLKLKLTIKYEQK